MSAVTNVEEKPSLTVEVRPAAGRPRRLPLDLAARFLTDRLRGLVGWSLGLSVYAILVVSIFPTIRDSAAFTAALEDYPDAIKELVGGEAGFDLTSGPGFLGAELYYLVLPLLLAIVAIGYGAAFGAEQESGLVDLILANPIRRRRLVLERALAIVVAVLALTSVVGVVVWISGGIVDLGIAIGNLIAGSVAIALLVVFHGMVALAVAAIFGRRAVAVGFATVLFAAGYLLSVAGGLLDWLEPAKIFSPYHQATGSIPLANGWSAGHLLVLAIESLAVLAVAVVGFERRDLS